MMDRFKKAGSSFAFHMALEVSRPDIVSAFREWLSQYTIPQFQQWVMEGKMPPLGADIFAQATPYVNYLDSISVVDLFELLGEASPTLASMIQDMGEPGATYVVNLREYLLDCCKHPEKAPATADLGLASAPDLVNITCESCKKSWADKKENAQKLEKCPFCGASAK